MEHLKDFVWMQKDSGDPVQVEACSTTIAQKMVAGYSQVFPKTDVKKEAK